MSSFYKSANLLWFPLMKKPSKKKSPFRPGRRLLRVEYGPHVRFLSPESAADLAGVSVQTVYKWIAGTQRMDPRSREVLYTRALGLLPDDRWRGWHIDENGRLTAPNGWSFYEGELLGLTILKQQNGALMADVARLMAENRQLRQAVDELQATRPPVNVVPFRPRRKKPGKARST